jgi:hypothetical protein
LSVVSHLPSPPSKNVKHISRYQTTSCTILLTYPTERRPRRPRPPPLNLPLHLRHSPHPPPNLRLPRLRTLQPDQPTLHPHRNWPNNRLHLSPLLHSNHPEPPNLTHRPSRPISRHSHHSSQRPLLHLSHLPASPQESNPPIHRTNPTPKLRRHHPRRALHRPTPTTSELQNSRYPPHPQTPARLPAHRKLPRFPHRR